MVSAGSESPTWNCGEMAVKQPGLESHQPCARVLLPLLLLFLSYSCFSPTHTLDFLLLLLLLFSYFFLLLLLLFSYSCFSHTPSYS